MSKRWAEQEQKHLLNVIPLYREKIKQKDLKEAKKITLEIADNISQTYQDVQGRTVNSIYERLPYLENLLAGVFKEEAYALKDQHLYSTLCREDGKLEPNLCNTRHKYNGYMTEYLNRTLERE